MEATMKEMTLEELAQEALRRRQQQQAEDQTEWRARTEEKAREAFRGFVGDLVEPDEVDGARIVIDGGSIVLLLRRRYATGYGYDTLHLEGQCPACGETTYGPQISNLADLGEALAEPFVPHYSHSCPPLDTDDLALLPTDERIAKALESIASSLAVMVV